MKFKRLNLKLSWIAIIFLSLIFHLYCSISNIQEVRKKYPSFEKFSSSCSSFDLMHMISRDFLYFGKFRTTTPLQITWEDGAYLLQFDYKDQGSIVKYNLYVNNSKEMEVFLEFCPDIVKKYIGKIPYAKENLLISEKEDRTKSISNTMKSEENDCDTFIGEMSCGTTNNLYKVSKEGNKFNLILDFKGTKTVSPFICRDKKLNRDIEDLTFKEMISFLDKVSKEKMLKNPGIYQVVNKGEVTYEYYDPYKKITVKYNCTLKQ